MQVILDTDPNGGDGVWVDVYKGASVRIIDTESDVIILSRDEAIAAARAILRHFNAGLDE